jgi:hypothetical protein
MADAHQYCPKKEDSPDTLRYKAFMRSSDSEVMRVRSWVAYTQLQAGLAAEAKKIKIDESTRVCKIRAGMMEDKGGAGASTEADNAPPTPAQ